MSKRTKAELASWDEFKYDGNETNDGYTFGLGYLDGNEVVDYEWFKTEEERQKSIRENQIEIVKYD